MLVMSLRVIHCEETPRFVKVCAGTLYAVALNDAGELWAWGENKNGQLGVAPCEEITEPVKILDNIKIPENVDTPSEWAAQNYTKEQSTAVFLRLYNIISK